MGGSGRLCSSSYDDGIDTEEGWSQSWEAKDHDVGISLIHLSTTKDDDGPPLHFQPYPEMIIVRRGHSTIIVGEKELDGNAGQTVVIPANMPHTFAPTDPSAMRASRSTPVRTSCQPASTRTPQTNRGSSHGRDLSLGTEHVSVEMLAGPVLTIP